MQRQTIRLVNMPPSCALRRQVHSGEETGDWVRIEAPDIARQEPRLLLLRESLLPGRGKQAAGCTCHKIAAATGRVEHTHAGQVSIGGISANIQYLIDQWQRSRVMSAPLALRRRQTGL